MYVLKADHDIGFTDKIYSGALKNIELTLNEFEPSLTVSLMVYLKSQ